jgi:hypothetical protein
MSSNVITLYDKKATNSEYIAPVVTTNQLVKDHFNFSFFVFAGVWYLTYARLGRRNYGNMKKHLLGFSAGFLTQKLYLSFVLRN